MFVYSIVVEIRKSRISISRDLLSPPLECTLKKVCRILNTSWNWISYHIHRCLLLASERWLSLSPLAWFFLGWFFQTIHRTFQAYLYHRGDWVHRGWWNMLVIWSQTCIAVCLNEALWGELAGSLVLPSQHFLYLWLATHAESAHLQYDKFKARHSSLHVFNIKCNPL